MLITDYLNQPDVPFRRLLGRDRRSGDRRVATIYFDDQANNNSDGLALLQSDHPHVSVEDLEILSQAQAGGDFTDLFAAPLATATPQKGGQVYAAAAEAQQEPGIADFEKPQPQGLFLDQET